MKKHQSISAGVGALALAGLLAGCAHQEAPPAPLAPVASATPAAKSPAEIQAMAKQHGYTMPPNAAAGTK